MPINHPVRRSIPAAKTMSLPVIRGTRRGASTPTMAYENTIPGGQYRSTIASITTVKTAAGADAIEVVYTLADHRGNTYSMKERLPVNSFAYERLGDALIAAGLNEGDSLSKAIGVEEDVRLHYPKPGGLGHFSTRSPATITNPHGCPDEDKFHHSFADEIEAF